MHQDDGSSVTEWANWMQDQIQRYFEQAIAPEWGGALGQMRSDMRQDLTARIHKLEVELAEMRGELRALRAGKGEVIDLPKMGWRRGDAA